MELKHIIVGYFRLLSCFILTFPTAIRYRITEAPGPRDVNESLRFLVFISCISGVHQLLFVHHEPYYFESGSVYRETGPFCRHLSWNEMMLISYVDEKKGSVFASNPFV